jgi:hypothetical protein
VDGKMAAMTSFDGFGQKHPALSQHLAPSAAPPFPVLGAKCLTTFNFTKELNNISTPFFEPEIKNIMADVMQRFETPTSSHKSMKRRRSSY